MKPESKNKRPSRCLARLARAVRRDSRAWDVDFYDFEGIRSIAVLGIEQEVMQWAQSYAKAKGIKRWVYKPFPEFNNRYEGWFQIANCPSWVLVRPNA